jgi:hypothetical protein
MSNVASTELALYMLQIILLALGCKLRLKAKRGTFATPISKARSIHSANKEFLRISVYLMHFAY